MSSTDRFGYWGPITSSVDWCEENYVYSHYIAEFWNTVSSLAMIALGLIGIYYHRKPLGWKFSINYLFIGIVGIGSVLFHATLQFEHQMWDEVPMVWTVSYLLWVLLTEQGYPHRVIYGLFIIMYCGFATYLTSTNQGSTQFYLFQISFNSIMWTDFYFIYKIYSQLKQDEIKLIFRRGTQFLFSALFVWLIDSNLCFIYERLPNPQLHAWWHILISISLHYFFMGCGYYFSQQRNQNVKLHYPILPFIPCVDLNDKNK